MKKFMAMLMAVVMVLSLTSCGSDKKAFEESSIAYDQISAAYEITEKMGSDIYEAWRIGIYDSDEINSRGLFYMADELSLESYELREGLAYTLASALYSKDWDELTEDEQEACKESSKEDREWFREMDDDLFSFCVFIVINTYASKGMVDTVNEALESAKTQMKKLSKDFSDYEHYPNLKGFYTTTKSFFEFIQSPSGSFEQVKDTINTYKNDARNYISDLDYIFE